MIDDVTDVTSMPGRAAPDTLQPIAFLIRSNGVRALNDRTPS
jgi:hypothetical protein